MRKPVPRSSKRLKVCIPVQIFRRSAPLLPLEGEILDISEGGAFIRCPQAVAVGEEILLGIQFNEIQRIEGRVIEWNQLDMGSGQPEQNEPPQVSRVIWKNELESTGFGV